MKEFFYKLKDKFKAAKPLNYILILLIWSICIFYALIPKGAKQVKNIIIDDLKYSGQIHDKNIEGEGKIIFPDGESYQGNLKLNEFDGQGEFIDSENRKIDGFFEEGKVKEKSQVQISNGNIWELGSDNTWTQIMQSSSNQNGIEVIDLNADQNESEQNDETDASQIESEGTGEN